MSFLTLLFIGSWLRPCHAFPQLNIYQYMYKRLGFAEVKKYLLKISRLLHLFSKPRCLNCQSFQLRFSDFPSAVNNPYPVLSSDVNSLHITSNCTVGQYTGQIFLYRSENLVNQNKVLKRIGIIISVQVVLFSSLKSAPLRLSIKSVKGWLTNNIHPVNLSLFDEYFIFCFWLRWCGIKNVINVSDTPTFVSWDPAPMRLLSVVFSNKAPSEPTSKNISLSRLNEDT